MSQQELAVPSLWTLNSGMTETSIYRPVTFRMGLTSLGNNPPKTKAQAWSMGDGPASIGKLKILLGPSAINPSPPGRTWEAGSHNFLSAVIHMKSVQSKASSCTRIEAYPSGVIFQIASKLVSLIYIFPSPSMVVQPVLGVKAKGLV